MDIQTSHLLAKLDRLIEQQRDHGELLRQILANSRPQTEPSEAPSPKLAILSGPIARGAMMWMLGVAILSYLARGGDPIALVELLLKSFG